MATDRINDSRAFRDFLDAKLSEGGTPTLEHAIGLWEHENATEAEREETREAIRQGLADVDAGHVRNLAEFDREFRRKHKLPLR